MRKLQSQNSNEKNQRTEREIEISKDYSKAARWQESIISRKRFRELRKALWKMGIRVHIPGNHASFSDEYCKKYAPLEESILGRLLP